MTDKSIAQAALIALTMQNINQRVAPLSTATMQGTVINRNIKIGETVCCYYNDSGELTRLGDIPAHTGDFFIDENNKMYYVEDNKLHIVDGFSGYVYSDSIDAYGFTVAGAGTLAAFKSASDSQTWRVIYPNGEMSGEIVIPDQDNAFSFGYRNDVLAIVQYTGRGQYLYGMDVYTYTREGGFIAKLPHLGNQRARPHVIVPINPYCVGVVAVFGVGLYDVSYYRYFVFTLNEVTEYYPWYGYDTTSGSWISFSYNESYIGADQSYIYTGAILHEDVEVEGGTTEHIVTGYAYGRFSIEHYNGLELLDNRQYRVDYYGPSTPYGSVIRRRYTDNENYVLEMVDVSTLELLYQNELLTLSASANTIRENEGWIWIVGSGVYQKTRLGWLMYSTSSYPKTAPWGKLGYSIRDTNIGKNGLAIVLFE